MFISGTSGHAAEDTQHKYPYMVDGHLLKLNFRKPIYELNIQQSTGGTLSGSPVSGDAGTVFGLTATPSTNHWHLDSYGVSGATLTGNSGTYINSDVSAKPTWTEDPKYTLTVQQTAGGTLTANKTTGYQNDTFTLTPTPATKYTFSAYQTTGTTMTGNNGKFNTSNVTAKAVWEYHPEYVKFASSPSDGAFKAPNSEHEVLVYKTSAGQAAIPTTFDSYGKNMALQFFDLWVNDEYRMSAYNFATANSAYVFTGCQGFVINSQTGISGTNATIALASGVKMKFDKASIVLSAARYWDGSSWKYPPIGDYVLKIGDKTITGHGEGRNLTVNLLAPSAGWNGELVGPQTVNLTLSSTYAGVSMSALHNANGVACWHADFYRLE